MKYLVLVLVIVLNGLLSACSDGVTSHSQAKDVTSAIVTGEVWQLPDTDTSLLEDFVNAMNNHYSVETLDLFNDSANLISVNQIFLGTTLPQNGYSYTCIGKAEIQGWLELQTKAITEIVPLSYKVSSNSVTLEAIFYYSNRFENIRVDAQIEEGRFSYLYFFIEKIVYA